MSHTTRTRPKRRSAGTTPGLPRTQSHLWTVISLLMLSGALACTSTKVVPLPLTPGARAEVAGIVRGRKAEVLLRSGQAFKWQDLTFAGDSIEGAPQSTYDGFRSRIAASDFLEVKVNPSRVRGALEGFLIGAAVGAAVGALAGPDESCQSLFCSSTRGEQAVFSGIGGALWGIPIGAIRGHRIKVVFQR